MSVDRILDCMGMEPDARAIQRVQTEHRLRLIRKWDIPAGATVLEVGCGQGDMTAALAWAVGEGGHVHGVDIASQEYGAPVTLGQARQRLLDSPLGPRLRMDFETDLLDDGFCARKPYDYVIFAHSCWYLSSREELGRLLEKTRYLAKRLCLAEWDLRARLAEQLPHLTAALLQAQCACFEAETKANIRTLFAAQDVISLALEAGWRDIRETTVRSPALQDGKWEVEMILHEGPAWIRQLDAMPQKLKDLLLSQIEMLKHVDPAKSLPLDVFVLTASHGDN